MRDRVIFLLAAAVVMAAVFSWPYSRNTEEGRIRTVEEAREAGGVVSENGEVTSGQEIWAEFYTAVKKGEPASVRLAGWFDRSFFEGGPVLYIRELVFDGEVYTLLGGEQEETYRYLLYFPNEPSGSGASAYECADRYVLTDDAALSWPEIFKSWFPSMSGNETIRSCEVYTEYVSREEPA